MGPGRVPGGLQPTRGGPRTEPINPSGNRMKQFGLQRDGECSDCRDIGKENRKQERNVDTGSEGTARQRTTN